jgi:hypothetical protein
MKRCYRCGSPYCLTRARDGYRLICIECEDDIALQVVGLAKGDD